MEAPPSGAEAGDGRLGITADRGSKSVEGVVEEPRRADGRADEPASDDDSDLDMAELTAKMANLEAHLAERGWGRLLVHLLGPVDVWLRISAAASWSVSEQDDWPQRVEAEAKGFVRPAHASLEFYKKKKYMREWFRGKRRTELDPEDNVFFDPETFPQFENTNPGTVTVEGYGLECWEVENPKKGLRTVFTNVARLPTLTAGTVLRRLDELQKGSRPFCKDRAMDKLDLKEIVGDLGKVYHSRAAEQDPRNKIDDLYMVLNRADDAFADFTREPSISLQAMSPDPRFTGIWNFLRQVILAKELAVRLQALEATLSFPGFTHRVLASLIVSDLWLNHVDIVLADLVINTDALKKEPGAREKAAAESFRKKGDEAMSKGEYKEAVGHYATAIQADPGNAVHRCNLSAARLADGALADAENDVYMATQLDPQSPRAWSFLGAARLKRGHSRRSEEAYERALSVAGQDEAATAAAREGLADARARTARTRTDMAQEPDPERRHRLRSVFLEQDYDIVGRNVNVRSRVHERQIDGLLAFARTLRWPHLADVRATAEAAYAGILVGRNVNVCLYDWLLGLMLPGKWFASIIMESLVQCSPSIRDRVGFAPSFECGLALPGASYWRCRTVLARVLGCRPGAAALCGWVGPCPPVAFDPPADVSEPPRYVLIRAQKAAMLEPGDSSSWLGPRIWQEQKLKRPAERASAFVAEMRDASRWTVPPPPALNDCVCETVEIRLSRLPPSEPEKKSGAEYRASVVVRLDKSPSPVTYTLLTNPVFVTLPPCRPRTLSGVPSLHDVHERELHRFKQRVWSVTELKGYTPEDAAEPGDVTVVNATGKGAEVLARAWCAEYGKNAAIRRPGGPCFACAVRAANGLDIRVLIWLD